MIHKLRKECLIKTMNVSAKVMECGGVKALASRKVNLTIILDNNLALSYKVVHFG